ncbi:mitochondrial 54S ribosomal protein uL22m [Calcarisporiella thermophila]|uniref:mitochondrial 54S ribosomal protein uL22m n=1 Tax=Calcarisporiella thermophila TaxID=911321 RepID=UPI003742FDC8
MASLFRQLHTSLRGRIAAGISRQLHTSRPCSAEKSRVPPLTRPELGASPLFDVATTSEAKVVDHTSAVTSSQLATTEYWFRSSNFKSSPRKMAMLARQIAGKPVNKAIMQMEFSAKRHAKKILHNLAFARTNAQKQLGFNPENMVVAQAWVGKGRYLKRVMPHGRGRHGIMHHPTSHVAFILKEMPKQQDGGRAARRNIRGWKETKRAVLPLPENKPIINPKPFYNW